MMSGSAIPSAQLDGFRRLAQGVRQDQPDAWQASSRLVGRDCLGATMGRLRAAVAASAHPAPLREALLAALPEPITSLRDLPPEALKQLTGLPATKALRALCVLFGVAQDAPALPAAALSPQAIETFLRSHANPFDLLVEEAAPSLLDLGAGDLSFATEVAEHYLPLLAARGTGLTLHGLDRLQAGSRLGGPLQADPRRIERLQTWAGLDFHLWTGQDMFGLDRIKKLRPRYTIVTCHAPPTPTLAYEPARFSAGVIEAHLRATKGSFRKVRVEGEDALEVLHQGRALLFPPWKFDVKGPVALLDLVARKGQLGVLGAVDNDVFWETLAQLLAEERFRPRDRIFTPSVLPEVFGEIYTRLSALPIGQSLALGDLGALRQDLPWRFRYVEVRRGATFDGQPAGRTARLFKDMKEEAPPWMLILVPDEEGKN